MGGIVVKSRPNRSRRQVGRSTKGELGAADPVTDPAELAALGQDVRRQLHGQPGGQESDQRSRPSDGTVTILFCDMVDYAGMTERLGDQTSREVLREHHRIVRDAIARHGGREISVQGDGFMVAFGGVAHALRCAIDIQRSFDQHVPRNDADHRRPHRHPHG